MIVPLRRATVALHFMHNTDPDTYHDESSLELQQERDADHTERRAESIRAQQQDSDDTNEN
jgi:hypothetical protein